MEKSQSPDFQQHYKLKHKFPKLFLLRFFNNWTVNFSLTGIKAMREMFQKQGRKDVPKVGIVITDGISKDPEKTAQQSLITKTSGVTIFAVGVSQLIDKIELISIASGADKVLSISTFDQLKSVVSTLVKEVCPTTTTSTTTTTTSTTTTTTTPAPTTTTSTTTSTTTPTTTTTMMTTTADWGKYSLLVAIFKLKMEIGNMSYFTLWYHIHPIITKTSD